MTVGLSTAAWLRRMTVGPEWRQSGDAGVNMDTGFIKWVISSALRVLEFKDFGDSLGEN